MKPYEDECMLLRMVARRYCDAISDTLLRIENRKPPRSREIEDLWHLTVYGNLLLTDYDSALVFLQRLSRALVKLKKIDATQAQATKVLALFDELLPILKKHRDVQEHIDDYLVGVGKNKDVNVNDASAFGVSSSSVFLLDEKTEIKSIRRIVDLTESLFARP